MNNSTVPLFLPVILLSGLIGCDQEVHSSPDLVVLNAKVVTIDPENPRAEAIAVTDGRITSVGSNDTIGPLINSRRTEVIDADGRLVTPGFNDAHTHFDALDLDYVDLRYITDPRLITQRVEQRVARNSWRIAKECFAPAISQTW
jgi:predicted amidohydrolase YtcJ